MPDPNEPPLSQEEFLEVLWDGTVIDPEAVFRVVAPFSSNVHAATGSKVYGEGEWKVRKYGWSKRRTWRKLHLAVNAQTQEIEAEVLTDNATDDAAVVDELLDEVSPSEFQERGYRLCAT